ncbi:PhnA protein [Pseudorhizobium endolithicum]|uniref:PhnA protein n=1 Tax=Pseudorhizobium endolithicum TaxID=1191678 RepID=A0ABM8PG85_9HYPH|nr:PhnA protein [Pseudorhizobium endolithicum]
MTGGDDDYVYDEATGEWRPASEMAAAAAEAAEVIDASGNVLKDGDSVTLIKDLKVKGAGQTLKQGTVIRSIRLTDIQRRSTAATTPSRASCCGRNSCASADGSVDRRPPGADETPPIRPAAGSGRRRLHRLRLPRMPRTIARPSELATERAALFIAASTTVSRW